MKKVLRKILLAIITAVGVLFLVNICLRVYFAANSEDEPLKDDSHLIPKIEKVADEDNAFFDLKKAGEIMYNPAEKSGLIDDMIAGKQWDQEFADELIAKNQKTFEYFESASGKKYFASPELQKIKLEEIKSDTILEPFYFFRHMQKIYMISAIKECKDGGKDECIRKVKLDLNLLNKLKNGAAANLIEYLVFIASSETFNRSINIILAGNSFDKNDSLNLQQAFEDNKNLEEETANVFKFEYLISRNELREINKNTDLSSIDGSVFYQQYWDFYYKPNKTLNLHMEKITEKNICRSKMACSEIFKAETSSDKYKGGFLKYVLKENAVGEILFQLANVDSDEIQKRRCQHEFYMLASQIKIASSAYEKDRGVVAKSIEELKNSGYLIPEVIVPARIYGWEMKYDDAKGDLVYPEDIQK